MNAPALRLSPQHLDSERSIIAAAILDPAARGLALSLVRPDQFYTDIHAAILKLIGRLQDEGGLSSVDENDNVNTILSAIDQAGILNQVTGGPNEFLTNLMDIPHTGHVRYHAGRIVKAASQREAINHLEAATRAAWDGESPDEIAERMATTAEAIRQGLTTSEDLRAITSRELDETEFQLDYLIPGILARRQFCLVAGPSKGCKTTTLCDLALALSSGCKFLNEFYVSRAVRVGMISAESGPGVLQETARRIARSKPWSNLADYENLFWKFDVPRLNEPGAARKLIQFVNGYQLEVLVLDPFYLMAGLSEDAGNMFVVGRLLADLQAVGNQTGVTLIVAHHFKKLGMVDQYAQPELGMVAWSGFEQYARQWLLLNRREAYDAENGLHRLWLAAGGSAGHGGLFAVDAHEGRQANAGGRCWQVTVTKASEARQQERQEREDRKEQELAQRLSRDAERVMAKLAANPEGLTKTRLRDLSGINAPKLTTALAYLLEQNMVEPCRVPGGNKQDYEGFKLATRTPVQPPVQGVRMIGTDGPSHTPVQAHPLGCAVRTGGVCASQPVDSNGTGDFPPDWESKV